MRRTMIRNSNKNHLRENIMRRKSLLESWLEDEYCYDCDKADWELDEEHCNLYGGDPTYCPECHERLSYGDGYPHCLNPDCGRYSPIDFDESVSEKEMRDSIKNKGHEKFVKELSNNTASGYKKALQYVYDQDTLSKDDFKKKYFDESVEVGKKVKVKDSRETGKVVKNAGEDIEINKVKLDKSGKVVEYSDDDLEVLGEALDADDEIEAFTDDLSTNGMANEVINLMNDEWDTIKLYQNALIDVDAYDVPNAEGIKKVFNDIIEEENKHVGQLQAILDELNGTNVDIQSGVEEGKEQLDGNDNIEITADAEIEIEPAADDDLDDLDEAFFNELLVDNHKN